MVDFKNSATSIIIQTAEPGASEPGTFPSGSLGTRRKEPPSAAELHFFPWGENLSAEKLETLNLKLKTFQTKKERKMDPQEVVEQVRQKAKDNFKTGLN